MDKICKMFGKSNPSSYKRFSEEPTSSVETPSVKIKKPVTTLPTIHIKNWGRDNEKTRLLDTEKTSNKNYKRSSFFK